MSDEHTLVHRGVLAQVMTLLVSLGFLVTLCVGFSVGAMFGVTAHRTALEKEPPGQCEVRCQDAYLMTNDYTGFSCDCLPIPESSNE